MFRIYANTQNKNNNKDFTNNNNDFNTLQSLHSLQQAKSSNLLNTDRRKFEFKIDNEKQEDPNFFKIKSKKIIKKILLNKIKF